MAKYQGEPRLTENVIRHFKPDDFVFVCDMCDLFGEWVPVDLIKIVLGRIASSPAAFLLLTKNPHRYFIMQDFLPKNAILGATVETNQTGYCASHAPHPGNRLYHMRVLRRYSRNRLFLSVEPILDFDDDFAEKIIDVLPWAVAVGYDNYDNHLPEPLLAKTMQLIDRLEKAGITVYRKTLREAWNSERA